MAVNKRLDISDYTGKGIRIAVVDSGIDPNHPDVKEVCGGVQIEVDPTGYIHFSDDYNDVVGHGTACGGIIKKIAPDVQLYSVRILDENLGANSRALAEAIRWAAKMKIDILNLSLGTTDQTYEDDLLDVCNKAFVAGVIMVASAHNEGLKSYPSVFSNVMGVKAANNACNDNEYFYHPGEQIEFSAYGGRQKVAWVNPLYALIDGSSFAAAHITGFVALILEKYPCSNFQEVKDILIANASVKQYNYTSFNMNMTSIKEYSVKYPWMEKAALYPYDDTMHNLVRFKELLNFEIVGVADFIQKGLVGKDAGEAILMEPIGIQILPNIKSAMENADTLIIGKLDEVKWRKSIFQAIESKKNICSLKPLNSELHSDILGIARQEGLKIISSEQPSISTSYYDVEQVKDIDIPVIGVFSTSVKPLNFAVQLALRKQLIREGYKIGQISTEWYSELFGFDVALPIHKPCEYSLNTISQEIVLLGMVLRDICMQRKPDILLVGTQGGIIPTHLSIQHCMPTFSSIAFIYGTKPDAYVLVVDDSDHLEYVRDSIEALRVLGKGKTILLIVVPSTIKASATVTQTMLHDLLEICIRNLEKQFAIPATEIFSETGQKKLNKVILDYFTVKDRQDEFAHRKGGRY